MIGNKVEKLLSRLEEICQSVRKTDLAKALIGFGSVAELNRIDKFSDLDFIVVANRGKKWELINNVEWLTSISPINYIHQSTKDSFKLIYKDGVYCDFGILEEYELKQIPHDKGRIIWSNEKFDCSVILPTHNNRNDKVDAKWEIGEALFDLYIGLCRYARGEKLSAARLIQNKALDHVLICSDILSLQESQCRDPFLNERRYEKRYPSLSINLPKMIQGYEKSPESALAILSYIDTNFDINQNMKRIIFNFSQQLIDKKDNVPSVD